MSGSNAPHRQMTMWAILLAMLGKSWSMSLRQERRVAPVAKLSDNVKQALNVTTEKSKLSSAKKLGDNVKVYEPQVSKPVGSLILLMGIGGHHSWTMKSWWYMDEAWSEKEQEWCCKDPSSMQCTCWFDDNDKAAVQRLRGNLRIVDAVGKVWYRKGNSWYKYQWWPDGPPVKADYDEAIGNVFDIIEHEYNILGDYRRIAVAGMSQGADLALSVGVRFPHQLGMVISQRGLLPEPELSGKRGNQSSARTPAIILGGDADELIPLSVFKSSCAALQGMKHPTYLKTHVCYGEAWGCHGSFSKTEWKLLINSFSLMLFPVHERHWEDQISHLTFWDSCKA
jgi:predicted esterase